MVFLERDVGSAPLSPDPASTDTTIRSWYRRSTASGLNVGGTPAWTGNTNERIPLTFLVWSPEPGVVLEITTTYSDRPVDDLVALAEQTSAIPIADGEAKYPS